MTIHPNLKCVIQILAYQCFFMKKKKALINAKSRNDFFGNTSLINKFRLGPLIIFLARVESVDPTKSSQQLLSLCNVACTICTIYMPTTYQAPSYLCACIKKYY